MRATDLIDADFGTINRRIFWECSIYDLELERIFARAWLFVAHESQIADPGTFVTTYMGGDWVIVTRCDDQAVNVFLNSCPHRGNRVCFADSGKERAFTCNYHGWAFGLDGALIKMPKMGLYKNTPGFDFAEWGRKGARVESYKGLVLATFDEAAPMLDDWLGHFRWYMDAVLDVEEGGTEFLPGGATRSVRDCNWKFTADNFAEDIYHALWTRLGGSEPTLGRYGGVRVDQEDSWQISVNGHGWEFNASFLGNAATMGDRELLETAFNGIFGINFLGALYGARAAVSALRESRGNLIVTGSNACFLAGGGGALYTASKFALRGMVMQPAKEFAPDVRANGVAPGATDTALSGPAALGQGAAEMNGVPARVQAMTDHMLLGRISRPGDHTSLYVLLAAASESGYVTGAMLRSDGGLTISV